MIEFSTDTVLHQNKSHGPLASIIPAYASLLSQQGYSQQYARHQVRFVADLNRWLQQHRLQIGDLTDSTLQRYMRSRHQRFRSRRQETWIMSRLLDLLHTQGLLPKELRPLLNDPHQSALNDFGRYLTEERGLAMSTRLYYRAFVQEFLSAQFADNPVDFAELNAEGVIRFIRNQAKCLRPKRAGLMVTALRSFFRHLLHRGDITVDLAACVPSIANWQLSSLPRFLQPHQVQQVLAHCDRRTDRGRRDYAILLLLARLGLRACEIVGLTLDDIHWQTGEITVKGKGKRSAQLPLPPDVGKAIADYLKKDRPACSIRRVFLCLRAPRRGFAGSQAVSTIVARALKRAGIDSPCRGAHLFRHSLATQMLGQGASLADIALLLRHRSLDTTILYAKVDLKALRSLAQPWRGGVQ